MSNTLSGIEERYNDLKNKDPNSLITFIPSTDVIESKPVGYSGEKAIGRKMRLLDYSFHTPETCKLGAGMKLSDIKFKEKFKLQNGKTPGLQFKIVNGDFNNDPKFFLDPKNNILNDK